MIGVVGSSVQQKAVSLVLAALRRSVSFSMAMPVSASTLANQDFLVVVDPDDRLAEELLIWLSLPTGRKLVIFGRLPAVLREHFGLTTIHHHLETSGHWASSPLAVTGSFSESPAKIVYTSLAGALGADRWERAFERFDFTDEWNNLGYGAVRADGSLWAISELFSVNKEYELASVSIDNESIATYSALFDNSNSSTLWVNRPVGTIDSFEWRLVERYISAWRAEDGLPCRPVLSELPLGYDCAVTMRLDCDEDITSAEFLWNRYNEQNVPFSLAIHTTHLIGPEHHNFLRSFREKGGAVLSHTATHAENWGGSYDAAVWEATEARKRILDVIGENVAYAVSPFHQSPAYALSALCDVGYRGCIGGIIRNDPEFVLARGGELADLPRGFIGHTQQCMLHGDCLLSDGDPIAVYKRAFDRAFATQTLFGFLDHPFSARYQYGWENETVRAKVHCDLIAYIRSRATRPVFLSEIEAMNFLHARASSEIILSGKKFHPFSQASTDAHGVGVEYCGKLVAFQDVGSIQ